jgi:hypothetical protein
MESSADFLVAIAVFYRSRPFPFYPPTLGETFSQPGQCFDRDDRP